MNKIVKKLSKTELSLGDRIKNQRDLMTCKACPLVAKHFDRDALRGYCSIHSLRYSLRTSKEKLSRMICNDILSHGDQEFLKEILEVAREHWMYKIQIQDKHRPAYYADMLARADLCISSIDKYTENIRKLRSGS